MIILLPSQFFFFPCLAIQVLVNALLDRKVWSLPGGYSCSEVPTPLTNIPLFFPSVSNVTYSGPPNKLLRLFFPESFPCGAKFLFFFF